MVEMHLYDYSFNLIWCEGLTILAVALLYAVWKAISSGLKKYPNISCFLLKIVIIAGPLMGLCMVEKYLCLNELFFMPLYTQSFDEYSFVYIPALIKGWEIIVYPVVLIWLIVAIFKLSNYVLEKKCLKSLHQDSETSCVLSQVLKKQKDALGIKTNVQIYVNNNISGPMTFWLLGYMIWIPSNEYAEEDLDLIVMHELTHITHKDVLFKEILSFISAALPFVGLWKWIYEDYTTYSETQCDISVCERIGDAHRYYTLIVSMLQESRKQKYPFNNISMMAKRGCILISRMSGVEDYAKRDVSQDGHVKRKTAVKFLLSAIMIGSIVRSVDAAAIYINEMDIFKGNVVTTSGVQKYDTEGVLVKMTVQGAKQYDWKTESKTLFDKQGLSVSNAEVWISEEVLVEAGSDVFAYFCSEEENQKYYIGVLKNGKLVCSKVAVDDGAIALEGVSEGMYQIIMSNPGKSILDIDSGLIIADGE